jgi:hypothetical protein
MQVVDPREKNPRVIVTQGVIIRGTAMFGNFEDIRRLNETNFEAMTKSFEAVSKRASVITTEMTDYSKRSFDNAAKTLEKLFGVRSLNAVIDVQSEYAKTVYDDFNSQIAKLGQHYADLAKVAFKSSEDLVPKKASAK